MRQHRKGASKDGPQALSLGLSAAVLLALLCLLYRRATRKKAG